MRPWQLVSLIAVTWVLAAALGWRPFWVLAWALTIAFALSVLWLSLSAQGLSFKRSALGGRAQVGERIEERLALENHSWVPKLWVQVTDGSSLPGHHAGYVSSVGPHQRIAWRARTLCRRRGRYTLGPVVATTGDPLGLFKRELALSPEHQLIVLPPVLPLARFDLYPGTMPGRGRGAQRSLQTTTNVVTVRNYVPGDALTRIHWPTTARLGEFMVKEFDLDPTIDVYVLLDLDRDVQSGEGDSSTEEYGVTIAASISAYCLRQQELAVGMAVSGAGEASLQLDRGERQLDRVLEMLAVVHPRQDVPLAEALAAEGGKLMRNTVLVVVTPSPDLDWAEALHHLQRRGVRPLVIAIDAHSFEDRVGGNTAVRDALTASGIPVIPIQRGDPLVHALEQGPI
ncbi:MAG TPA: DUF58 domain-containing protein [Ktedonobacterales bacterium]|nr:DUF58 domain-containing protein [Ktedonobacterales bacterium]